MTHTRNTPASETAGAEGGRENPSPDLRQPTVRKARTLPAEGYEGRARRARAEPMTVRPLRDGRYVVETAGGTYVVAVDRSTCTCPDSAIRGARCKHIRRVAAEIGAGHVPAPDERERVCAVCGGRAFVPLDADGPALCERHDHAPGDFVRDRETGTLLVVVDAIAERADEARTDEGRIVANYETNAAYGGHEPVFAVRYVDALPSRDETGPASGDRNDPDERSVDAEGRRYLFPASRLRPVELDTGGAEDPTAGDSHPDCGPESGLVP
jgi:hypothetical protein